MNFQDKFNTGFKSAGFPMPEIIQKNKIITFVLALLLGVFGAHRFYLGKFITGFFQLILGLIFIWGNFAWICYIFVIIDLIRIVADPRFTKKIKFNINIDVTNFSKEKTYTYTNSPFSNMHNRNENENDIRELKDNEVVVIDSHQLKITEEKK